MPTKKEYNIVLPFFAKIKPELMSKYELNINVMYCFTESLEISENNYLVKTLCGTMVSIHDLDIAQNMYVN